MFILKTIKWCFISLLTLFLILTLIFTYITLSFDTQNFPENHGKAQTKLFTGSGKNQPLIVGFGGSEGGNAWASDYWKPQRDRFLEQGYSFLALGYFGSEGTPEKLDRISLDGIHNAIMQTAKNPNINKQCIILMGGSKGAELSLALASRYEDFKSVVAIVPGSSVFSAITLAMNTSSFSHHNQPLDFVPVPFNTTLDLLIGDHRAAFQKMMNNQKAMEEAAIQVENINGPLLLISATKDEMWPSSEMSEMMVERLLNKKFPHYFKHIAIDGGHAEPLKHFDKIESFLQNQLMQGESSACNNTL